MRLIDTVPTLAARPQVAQPPSPEPGPVHIGTVHSLSELAGASSGRQLPPSSYVATPGAGVWVTYEAGDPSELMAFGATDHVLLTVFDPDAGKGAVLNIDRNDPDFIEEAIVSILEQMGERTPQSKLTAFLFGGRWTPSPDDTGARLRDGLADRGITPTWHQWSFPMDREDHHGVLLDVATGQVTVFEHPAELAAEFLDGLPQDLLELELSPSASDDEASASGSRRTSLSSSSGLPTPLDWPSFDSVGDSPSPRRASASSDPGSFLGGADRAAPAYRIVYGPSTGSLNE